MAFRRWLRRGLIALGVLVVILATAALSLWIWLQSQLLDSGGPLRPRQAAYDVRRSDLAVTIDPGQRVLSGSNRATLATVAPLDAVELHLDGHLSVRAARIDGGTAPFTHADGLLTVTPDRPWGAGERVRK